MVRNVYDTCLVLYSGRLKEGETPTKAMMNTVEAMCAGGAIKSAFKVGRRWLTDLEKEGEMYAGQ